MSDEASSKQAATHENDSDNLHGNIIEEEIFDDNLSLYEDLSEYNDTDDDDGDSDTTFDGFHGVDSKGNDNDDAFEGFGSSFPCENIPPKTSSVQLSSSDNSSEPSDDKGLDPSFEGFRFDSNKIANKDSNVSGIKSKLLEDIILPLRKKITNTAIQCTKKVSPSKPVTPSKPQRTSVDIEDLQKNETIGPNCTSVGCTVSWLESGSIMKCNVSNGMVVELTDFAKKIAWEKNYIAEWILRMKGVASDNVSISDDDLKKIHLVNKRRKAISVTFSGKNLLKSKLAAFDKEIFYMPFELEPSQHKIDMNGKFLKIPVDTEKNKNLTGIKENDATYEKKTSAVISISKSISDKSVEIIGHERNIDDLTLLTHHGVLGSNKTASIESQIPLPTPVQVDNSEDSDSSDNMIIDKSYQSDAESSPISKNVHKTPESTSSISEKNHINIFDSEEMNHPHDIIDLPKMKETATLNSHEVVDVQEISSSNLIDSVINFKGLSEKNKATFGQHIIFASKKGKGDFAGKNIQYPVFEVRNNFIGPFCVKNELDVQILNVPTRKIPITNGIVIEMYVFFKERGATLISLVHKLHQLMMVPLKVNMIKSDMIKLQEVVNTELHQKTDYFLEKEFDFTLANSSQNPPGTGSTPSNIISENQTEVCIIEKSVAVSDDKQMIMDDLEKSKGLNGSITRGDIVKLYYAWLQMKNKDKDSVFVIDLLNEVENLMISRAVEVIRIPVGTLMSSSVKLFEEYQDFRKSSPDDALSYLEDNWLEDIQYLVSAANSRKTEPEPTVSAPKNANAIPSSKIVQNNSEHHVHSENNEQCTNKSDELCVTGTNNKRKYDFDNSIKITSSKKNKNSLEVIPIALTKKEFNRVSSIHGIDALCSCRVSTIQGKKVLEYLVKWKNSKKVNENWISEENFTTNSKLLKNFWKAASVKTMQIRQILNHKSTNDNEVDSEKMLYLVQWQGFNSKSWIIFDHFPQGSVLLVKNYCLCNNLSFKLTHSIAIDKCNSSVEMQDTNKENPNSMVNDIQNAPYQVSVSEVKSLAKSDKFHDSEVLEHASHIKSCETDKNLSSEERHNSKNTKDHKYMKLKMNKINMTAETQTRVNLNKSKLSRNSDEESNQNVSISEKKNYSLSKESTPKTGSSISDENKHDSISKHENINNLNSVQNLKIESEINKSLLSKNVIMCSDKEKNLPSVPSDTTFMKAAASNEVISNEIEERLTEIAGNFEASNLSHSAVNTPSKKAPIICSNSGSIPKLLVSNVVDYCSTIKLIENEPVSKVTCLDLDPLSKRFSINTSPEPAITFKSVLHSENLDDSADCSLFEDDPMKKVSMDSTSSDNRKDGPCFPSAEECSKLSKSKEHFSSNNVSEGVTNATAESDKLSPLNANTLSCAPAEKLNQSIDSDTSGNNFLLIDKYLVSQESNIFGTVDIFPASSVSDASTSNKVGQENSISTSRNVINSDELLNVDKPSEKFTSTALQRSECELPVKLDDHKRLSKNLPDVIVPSNQAGVSSLLELVELSDGGKTFKISENHVKSNIFGQPSSTFNSVEMDSTSKESELEEPVFSDTDHLKETGISSADDPTEDVQQNIEKSQVKQTYRTKRRPRIETLSAEEKCTEMNLMKQLPLSCVFGKRVACSSLTEAVFQKAQLIPVESTPVEKLKGKVFNNLITIGRLLAIYDEWRIGRANAGITLSKDNIDQFKLKVRKLMESHQYEYKYDDCILDVCYSMYLTRVKMNTVTEIMKFNDSDCLTILNNFHQRHLDLVDKYYAPDNPKKKKKIKMTTESVFAPVISAFEQSCTNREEMSSTIHSLKKCITDIEGDARSETAEQLSEMKQVLTVLEQGQCETEKQLLAVQEELYNLKVLPPPADHGRQESGGTESSI